MHLTRSAAVVAALALSSAGGVFAQTSGTYATDTGYSIHVEARGDILEVREPNKTSRYRKTAPGVFEFTNPTNDITYGIRVLNASTLEAFKPGSPHPGTRLALRGGATYKGAAPAGGSERYQKLADTYMERSQSDPANAQAWTTCSAAALARVHHAAAEAERFAHQAATMLKLLHASSSPCPEVISQSAWDGRR
jgi:hypothetical protein